MTKVDTRQEARIETRPWDVTRYLDSDEAIKWRPSAPATGIGLIALCTDHE